VPESLESGHALVKVMYLSLGSVSLQRRGDGGGRGSSAAAASAAWPLRTEVGDVVKSLGVGVVVGVGQGAGRKVGVGQIVGGELGWCQFSARRVDDLVVLDSPEELDLPAVLATLQAAHDAVGACVSAGLLPLTSTDRAACCNALQGLVSDWVTSGRLSYDPARHARELATAPLEALATLYRDPRYEVANSEQAVAWVKIAQPPSIPLRAKL
jgi:hypothetical protein